MITTKERRYSLRVRVNRFSREFEPVLYNFRKLAVFTMDELENYLIKHKVQKCDYQIDMLKIGYDVN